MSTFNNQNQGKTDKYQIPFGKNQSITNPSGQSSGTQQAAGSSAPENSEGSGDSRQAPITLPTGGGAIRGIGEKFQANPATGTASFTVPLPISEGRGGFTPQLALGYDSGSGNSPFGLGWNVGLPAITRKTDKGIPQYNDHPAGESDTFILSGAEDLVPVLENGERSHRTEPGFDIYAYRPRTEGLFARIERWVDTTTRLSHWRSISKENVTSVYGRTPQARIADPADPQRIFSWLLEESWDAKGNLMQFTYKQENTENIAASCYERHRLQAYSSPSAGLGGGFSNRYLKQVAYGNQNRCTPGATQSNYSGGFHFYLVFDYGEHNRALQEENPWAARPDAFSNYRAGFEIRTYRLCQRALMFHHFPELGAEPVLVKSLHLQYENNAAFSLLEQIEQAGHDGPNSEELPPLQFTYTQARVGEHFKTVPPEMLRNLPAGVDGNRYQWADLYSEGVSGILTQTNQAWYFKPNQGDACFTQPEAESAPVFGPMKNEAPKPAAANTRRNSFRLGDVDSDGFPELILQGDGIHGFYSRDEEGCWLNFRSFEHQPNLNWGDANLRFIDLSGDGLADLVISRGEHFDIYLSEGKKGYGSYRRVRCGNSSGSAPQILFSDAARRIFLADMSGDGLTDIVKITHQNVTYWPNLGYGRFGEAVVMSNPPLLDSRDRFDPCFVYLADVDGTGTTDLLYISQGKVRYFQNLAGNGWQETPVSGSLRIHNTPQTQIQFTDLLGNGTQCLVVSSPLPGQAQTMHYCELTSGIKPFLLSRIDNRMGRVTRLQYAPSTKFYMQDKLGGRPWITKLPFVVQVLEKVETTDLFRETVFTNRYAYHHGYYDPAEREFRGFGLVEQWDAEESTSPGGGTQGGGTQGGSGGFSPPVYTKTWFHTGCPPTSQGSLPERFSKEYWQGDPEAWHLPDTELPAGLTAAETRESFRALRGSPLRVEMYSLEEPDPLSTFNFQFSIPYTVEEKSYTLKCLQPQGKNKYAVFLKTEAQTLGYHYERQSGDPRIAHSLVLETDPYGNPTKTLQVAYPRRAAEALPEQQKMPATYTENAYTGLQTPDTHLVGVPYQTRQYEIHHLEAMFPNGGFVDPTHALALQNTPGIDFAATPAANTLQKRLIADQRMYYNEEGGENILDLGEVSPQALVCFQETLELTPGLIEQLNQGQTRLTPDLLATTCRYLQEGGNWYAQSETLTYAGDAFYTILNKYDPFGACTTYAYDPYTLFPVEITNALGHTIRAEYDYRVLQPRKVTDPNGNSRVIAFNTLGLVSKLALQGKNGEGDTLSSPTETYDYHLEAVFQPLLPCYSIGGKRETHADPGSRWLESYTYYDGAGQPLLTKTTAEGGEAREWENGQVLTRTVVLRWLASGKTILNNKSKPVKQYEPWYATTPAFEAEASLTHYGVTPLMHYDPLGRLVQTDFPDGATSKVEFSVWQQKNYDPNDCDPGSAHYNTPQVLDFDGLGRPFQTTDDNGLDSEGNLLRYVTCHQLDITGRIVETTDALGRSASKNTYALSEKHLLSVDNIDSGQRWLIADAAGKPAVQWDSRGHCIRYAYDLLQRPIETRVGSVLVEKTVYGADAAVNNIGQIAEIYAQDGKTSFSYDFKGNPLEKTYAFLPHEVAQANWDIYEIPQSNETFCQQFAYDALNRPVSITQPDGKITHYYYDQGALLKEVWQDENQHITNIIYNARGQREAIYYGNGTRTAYTYHPKNFRLIRLWTTRNAATEALQDLNYTYDAAGNITEIYDAVQEDQYFNNSLVSSKATYRYDALYRLVEATGRELYGLAAPNATNAPEGIPVSPNNALQNYTHQYKYDALGNLLEDPWKTYEYADSGANNYLLGHDGRKDLYTYDAHGNIISMPHLGSMVWDYKDQLVGAGVGTPTSVYRYTIQGNRSCKIVYKGNIREERYYMDSYEIFRKYTNQSLESETRTHNFADDQKVFLREDCKGEETPVYFYQYDNHLGSACLELDENAALISYEEYHPFGTTSYRVGKGETEVSLKRYKYCGKERDEETGLYYYGMRYYAAWICRFVSVDPLQFKYPHYTPYQYAGNKPITYIDLDGLEEAKKEEKPKENIKKNIYIALDFNKANPRDKFRDVVEFQGMEEKGWHGIYAANLQDAEAKLCEYLNGEKADTILLQSHGTTDKEVTKTYLYTDNNSSSFISSSDLGKYYKSSASAEEKYNLKQERLADIEALISIVENVKEGKNFILHACYVAKNDEFMGSLQLLTGSKIDMYAFMDEAVTYYRSAKKVNTAIIEPTHVLEKSMIEKVVDGAKRYPEGYKEGDTPILLENIQITSHGIRAVKKK